MTKMKNATAVKFHRPCDAEELIALFERIAHDEGWQPNGQLRSRTAHSEFFGLLSGAGELIGGLQLVCPDVEGKLPCQMVWPEVTPDLAGGTAHVGVLAVVPEWRGRDGGLFWLLTAEMWRYCVLSGIREIWLEATPRTMRCYQRLGWPLKIRGPLRDHWGEPCYVCSLDIREVAGSLAEKAVRSNAYRDILTGAVSARMPRVSAIK